MCYKSPLPVVSDLCADDPCLNGGTCTDRNGQIACLCLPTYGGDFCQTGEHACYVAVDAGSVRPQHATDELPAVPCGAFRLGAVRARLGQVSGFLLPTLQPASELGGG